MYRLGEVVSAKWKTLKTENNPFKSNGNGRDFITLIQENREKLDYALFKCFLSSGERTVNANISVNFSPVSISCFLWRNLVSATGCSIRKKKKNSEIL